jgi:uncharacterized protein (TIGR02145 family)
MSFQNAIGFFESLGVQPEVITDVDGNVYTYVTIGTQQWLVENLKTTKYADGSPIPNLTADADWIAEDGTPGHDGAYCWYDNDIANKDVYGALYNWYAVDNTHGLVTDGINYQFTSGGIYSMGWRVPSDIDFATLDTFLGITIAGQKLKEEIEFGHWLLQGGTDDYGFKGVGAGWRESHPFFSLLKNDCYFWSSDEEGLFEAHVRRLSNTEGIFRLLLNASKAFGVSVRCMRDI